MIKTILLSSMLVVSLFAGKNNAEKLFWDEVKNSNDIELLKAYKENFPEGIFESIADIKIKRLRKATITKEDDDGVPFWVNHKNALNHKYYGIGFSNKHYNGKHYQENLARSRAKKELMKKFDADKIPQDTMYEYFDLIQSDQYTDDRGRIYVLLYVDNYDLK
jgi:hypothetical protein